MCKRLTGLKWAAALGAAVCGALACGAAEAALSFGFDHETPGAWPQKWNVAWGAKPVTHQVYVSNVESVSRRNCLVVDSGPPLSQEPQWALGVPMADIPDGWAVFSFCFKIQGSGNDTAYLALRFIDSDWKIAGGTTLALGNKRVMFGETQLGAWEANNWYRVILWLPTRGGKQTMAQGLLQRQQLDGIWAEVAGRKEVPVPPSAGFTSLQLITGRSNFVAYFDDLRASRESSLEIPGALGKITD